MNFSLCLYIIFTILFVSNPYIAQSVQDNLYEFVRYVIFHYIYLFTLGKYVCNLYQSGVHQYAEYFDFSRVKKMSFMKFQCLISTLFFQSGECLWINRQQSEISNWNRSSHLQLQFIHL